MLALYNLDWEDNEKEKGKEMHILYKHILIHIYRDGRGDKERETRMDVSEKKEKKNTQEYNV